MAEKPESKLENSLVGVLAALGMDAGLWTTETEAYLCARRILRGLKRKKVVKEAEQFVAAIAD